MQELFVNKIHFFKFLSSSDKPWLDQLKLLQCCFSSRGTSVFWRFHWCKQGEIPTRKWKYPVLRTNAKPQQLIKHIKISYSLTSLASRDFSRRTYRNGLNRGASKLKPSKYSKSTNRVGWIPFVGNRILLYSYTGCVTSKNYLCLGDHRSSLCWVNLKSKTKDAHP